MAVTSGFPVVLQRSISSVYTTIANGRDLQGPSGSKTMIDTTTKSSTARTRTFIPGLIDEGEISLNIVYNPDEPTTVQLITDFQSSSTTAADWKILVDTDDTCTFSGYVSGFSPSAPMDDVQTADITIKVTGVATRS